MSSEASQIDTVQDVFIKFAFIENKHFFTKSFHRQTSQNYEQPPQRFVLSKLIFSIKHQWNLFDFFFLCRILDYEINFEKKKFLTTLIFKVCTYLVF